MDLLEIVLVTLYVLAVFILLSLLFQFWFLVFGKKENDSAAPVVYDIELGHSFKVGPIITSSRQD